MSDVIVIGGKGGVGKTTIAALIIAMLARCKKGSVLAVDADPNSNLGEALGLKEYPTVADVVDEVGRDPDVVPKNMGKDAYIELEIHQGITESDGYDFLAMGRPEGPGCYCYINNVLRNLMGKLTRDYKFVVIDNEAGLEHFSRKTTRACDKLLIISDETVVGLKAASRILSLVEEMGIPAKKRYLVVNRARRMRDEQLIKKTFSVDGVFFIPYDEKITEASVEGAIVPRLTQENVTVKGIVRLGDILWPAS